MMDKLGSFCYGLWCPCRKDDATDFHWELSPVCMPENYWNSVVRKCFGQQIFRFVKVAYYGQSRIMARVKLEQNYLEMQ